MGKNEKKSPKTKKNPKKIWKFQIKSLSLQRVFHSIRFKVNKVWRLSGASFFVLHKPIAI